MELRIRRSGDKLNIDIWLWIDHVTSQYLRFFNVKYYNTTTFSDPCHSHIVKIKLGKRRKWVEDMQVTDINIIINIIIKYKNEKELL